MKKDIKMVLLDRFIKQAIKEDYGFAPDQILFFTNGTDRVRVIRYSPDKNIAVVVDEVFIVTTTGRTSDDQEQTVYHLCYNEAVSGVFDTDYDSLIERQKQLGYKLI